LTVSVPSDAASGKIYVQVGSVKSNGVRFKVTTIANQAPTVNAGPDQTITQPSGAVLSGTATDDDLPTGSTLTVTWTQLSGPGSVSFGDIRAIHTPATFSTAGTYILRITASDTALTSSDDVVITVNLPAVTNQPPVVNAGSDQTITLPASATLSGTAADDGLPTGSTVSVTWSKSSGLGTVTFGNPAALSTNATFSVAGTYVLQLTATDGALSASGLVTILATTG